MSTHHFDDHQPVFVISVAAELAGMHPQTLRTYDRLGIVSPSRTSGRGRRYSAVNIAQLKLVQQLSQDDGVNLAGIKRIMELESRVQDLEKDLERTRTALERVHANATRVFAASRTGEVTSLQRGERPRPRSQSRAMVLWNQR